jgi:hypothetical protein
MVIFVHVYVRTYVLRTYHGTIGTHVLQCNIISKTMLPMVHVYVPGTMVLEYVHVYKYNIISKTSTNGTRVPWYHLVWHTRLLYTSMVLWP